MAIFASSTSWEKAQADKRSCPRSDARSDRASTWTWVFRLPMSPLNPIEHSLSLVWIDYRSRPRCRLCNFTYHFPSQYKVPWCGVWESQLPLPVWGPWIWPCMYLAKGRGRLGSSLDGEKVTQMECKGLHHRVNCEVQYLFRLLSLEVISIKRAG